MKIEREVLRIVERAADTERLPFHSVWDKTKPGVCLPGLLVRRDDAHLQDQDVLGGVLHHPSHETIA